MPERCPLCDAEVVKPEGEVMHRCPNRACPSRGLETLINWVTAAMDIEGVGEQFVRRLWELGLLRSMPDLYRLTKEQLLELDGFQERSASNVLASIEASKRSRTCSTIPPSSASLDGKWYSTPPLLRPVSRATASSVR